jgi:hypothetical protein
MTEVGFVENNKEVQRCNAGLQVEKGRIDLVAPELSVGSSAIKRSRV